VTQNGWPDRFVRTVAGEVRRYRKQARMSAQQLSDRCEALGLPIKRSVLANLESGRRTTISVPELLILAEALGVVPMLLLFPLGREETVEVLPGRQVDPWDAVRWFDGVSADPGNRNAEPSDRIVYSAVNLYGLHEQAAAVWPSYREAVTAAWSAVAEASTEDDRQRLTKAAEAGDARMDVATKTVLGIRYDMRKAGMILPKLEPLMGAFAADFIREAARFPKFGEDSR
jgi:transcriptional regulator with XRE-family HTH domain